MARNQLALQQLQNKLEVLAVLRNIVVPPTGWIGAIRLALGISLEQLGKKLSITRQAARDIERREKDGSITLKGLKQVAQSMDLELVYGFVPKDGSLDKLIDRKARELATKIVMRTSNTMKLEEQEVSYKRLEKAIEERATAIKNEMPKTLWD